MEVLNKKKDCRKMKKKDMKVIFVYYQTNI